MKPHKWAKEIKAWADGAEIQWKVSNDDTDIWTDDEYPDWRPRYDYRIKPQPKEPQYLYVYGDYGGIDITTDKNTATKDMEYIGKIKLEQDDE